ncbi:GntR family transcriptional regulator [Phytohabitans suffuscus]|uniref:GntR family transcriptional regulator n=1 Tax=Phytohabitans suffuscus TaxID=624315 RepID=A0A6F8YUW7_9ACTN|nr:GntR family transcriptional regulator [Phytohabitans suffuscus]BCB89912.1 GntR family transcriptional regulator [Phytohabitans suffuscus]
MGTFTRPQTAQQAVLEELRRAILAGELAPGAQIVQEAVAERLGLSRVPVREALKILEGEGQVRYQAHHGYFVTELDVTELLEIYAIRDLLESAAVTAAVPRLEVEDVVRMETALADMAKAAKKADIVAMTAANRRFHFALFEASGKPRFVKIIRQLWDASEPYRSLYYAEPVNRTVVRQEHKQIVEAARNRQADLLVKLLAEHRSHAITRLRTVLDRS